MRDELQNMQPKTEMQMIQEERGAKEEERDQLMMQWTMAQMYNMCYHQNMLSPYSVYSGDQLSRNHSNTSGSEISDFGKTVDQTNYDKYSVSGLNSQASYTDTSSQISTRKRAERMISLQDVRLVQQEVQRLYEAEKLEKGYNSHQKSLKEMALGMPPKPLENPDTIRFKKIMEMCDDDEEFSQIRTRKISKSNAVDFIKPKLEQGAATNRKTELNRIHTFSDKFSAKEDFGSRLEANDFNFLDPINPFEDIYGQDSESSPKTDQSNKLQ